MNAFHCNDFRNKKLFYEQMFNKFSSPNKYFCTNETS